MSVPQAQTTNRLILCGALAGPLFIASFMVQGATRAGYNPLRHPVSSLALGDGGWVQTLTFIVTGLLILAFAVGLWRVRRAGGSTAGAVLVGIAGTGVLGAGLFVTDPLSGYPPGTPDELIYTPMGILHDVFSMLFFFGLPLAAVVFARRFFAWKRPGWALYALASAVLFVGFFIPAGIGFQQEPGLVDSAGALQRLSIVTGLIWLMLLAWLHRDRPGAA